MDSNQKVLLSLIACAKVRNKVFHAIVVIKGLKGKK